MVVKRVYCSGIMTLESFIASVTCHWLFQPMLSIFANLFNNHFFKALKCWSIRLREQVFSSSNNLLRQYKSGLFISKDIISINFELMQQLGLSLSMY